MRARVLVQKAEMHGFIVRKAVEKARQQKAPGFDSIPYEVFKNDIAISFLHIFFNVCYQTGKTPSDWGKGVLNPIPNPGMADPREPLNYRGLNLAPTMYKLYCSVLNERLSQWLNNSSKIVDEQNGFRKKRSTVDHLSSLSSVVESRIRKKQSTFAAFIDFSKAYDYVNLSLLFSKLKNLDGHMTSYMTAVMVSVRSDIFWAVKTDVFIDLPGGHMTSYMATVMVSVRSDMFWAVKTDVFIDLPGGHMTSYMAAVMVSIRSDIFWAVKTDVTIDLPDGHMTSYMAAVMVSVRSDIFWAVKTDVFIDLPDGHMTLCMAAVMLSVRSVMFWAVKTDAAELAILFSSCLKTKAK
ncbi:RTXE-like protein [Mya arenaria]|uniref:RTXE-like protein n=1 Tax=Mya arenaria TaxID=6604 RepID=A0ABY7G6J7_MYAAR|nr:RTXE-like protein [Mya arenaria]